MQQIQLQPFRIERVRAIGNHQTFQIPPIKRLIAEEIGEGVVIEPFPFQSKLDVFDYLDRFADNSTDYGLIDPPYSKRQVSDHYKEMGVKVTGWHTSSGWTAKVKFEVGRVMKIGGKTITFGWNSSGIGRANGFDGFAMPYDKSNPYQRARTRWENHKAIRKSVPWSEYHQGAWNPKVMLCYSEKKDR